MKILIVFSLVLIGFDWVILEGTLFNTMLIYFSHLGTFVTIVIYLAAIYFAFAMIGLMLNYFKEMPLPLILELEEDGDLGSDYEFDSSETHDAKSPDEPLPEIDE